mmetsp:Transcript_24927/g.41329  ORF Transcript_24927/g.41329 Transcript_24927/m.41329 type:complete len:325 (-) Transcript_24927:129-1103(-)
MGVGFPDSEAVEQCSDRKWPGWCEARAKKTKSKAAPKIEGCSDEYVRERCPRTCGDCPNLHLPTCNTLTSDEPTSHYLELLRRALVGATALFSRVELLEVAGYRNDRNSGLLQNAGWTRMRNLQCLADDVVRRGVPGDFVECGIWRGGVVAFLAGYVKVHHLNTSRHVWGYDSFAGVPSRRCPPSSLKCKQGIAQRDEARDVDPYFIKPREDLAVSLGQVRGHLSRYGLLRHASLVPGWFSSTLPHHPTRIALLRVDGDLYSSTMTVLTELYPRLSVGGWVVLDDWDLHMSKNAVLDYRRHHNLTERISFHSGHLAYSVARRER